MLPPLTGEITSYFSGFDAHTVQNLFVITQGIFSAKSTNLNEVKDELGNILNNQKTTKPESNYRRIIRFYQMPNKKKEDLVKCLLCLGFSLLNLKGKKPKYLALDGPSWEYGLKKIHLITLNVVVNGVSILIWWEELSKKGISNLVERKGVLVTALTMYNLKGMILLADREYIGEEWFKYLKDSGLNFIIRLNKGIYKEYIDEQRQGQDNNFKHQRWRYRGLEYEAKKKQV